MTPHQYVYECEILRYNNLSLSMLMPKWPKCIEPSDMHLIANGKMPLRAFSY